jgi:hypothetical protein
MKLGELLATEPLPDKRASSAKGTCSLPRGVTKKVSHQAQTLSDHRDIVAQVAAKARETGSIPMANEIYKIIMSGARHRRSVYKEYGSARIALRNAQVR